MPLKLDRAKAVTTGYSSEPELEWLARVASHYNSIVEIGAWTGRTTLALAENTSGTVHVVDTWRGSVDGELKDILARNGADWARNEFLKNTEGIYNLRIFHMSSAEAAKLIPSADMVFIDASHNYESVREDIQLWLPKLKANGLICGHDFGQREGVTSAVKSLLGGYSTMVPYDHDHSIWWRQ